MKIRCGFELEFESAHPSPMMLMLSVRPERHADLLTPEVLQASGGVAVHQYRDGFGNVCSRIMAPAGKVTVSSDFLLSDSGEPDPVVPDAVQHAVEDLPDEVLVYLLASRYCETDLMVEEAWRLFGATPLGWARVQAIVDYTHERITFGYPHARPTRTAREAHSERMGVCRDFAHLAVTLCRCMNIPARYVTGYLGDIGVAPVDAAMDFSAWFQVWLGGAWRTFDARHNKPRIGRVLMAVGRDATDVALSTTFGTNTLTGFKVITEEVG